MENLSDSLDHIRLLPSLDNGHRLLALEEEMLSMTVTELTRLQAGVDPKHVDNLVHTVS